MEKKVPKLRFKEFSSEWETKKLGDVCNKPMYGLNSASKDYDGNNGYLRITDINESSRRFIKTNITSPCKLADDYLLSEGDILFTRTGASTGKSYLYIKEDGKLYFAGFLIRFRIKTGDQRFFFYQTLLPSYNKWVLRMSMRSGQPGINAEEYSQLPISIPELSEQVKIASFLTSVDRKIEMLEKQLELQERYKKGMMQKLFSQEIRFKDENVEEFPEWEEKRLGQLGEFYNGLTGKSGNDFGTGVPFITYKSIFDSSKIDLSRTEKVEITEEERSKGKQNLVKKGDMFFTVSSETPDEVGMVSVLLDDVGECYLNSFCFGFRINNLEANLPDFFRFYLHSDYFRKATYILAQGSTRYNVSKEGLSRINLKVPCYSEQSAVAIILVSLQSKIESTKKQIEISKQWKKGLLQQMFV